MARAGSSFFTVTDGPPPPGAERETGPTIIWLRGEHDIATDGALRRTLEGAVALNDAAILIDLSEVELLASTLGVILAARNSLRQQSRSLTMVPPLLPTSGASSAFAACKTFSVPQNEVKWQEWRSGICKISQGTYPECREPLARLSLQTSIRGYGDA